MDGLCLLSFRLVSTFFFEYKWHLSHDSFSSHILDSDYVDRELKRFFARRSYRGAVVTVSRLNQGEFVALLGDAAHSVLPATGEGRL